MNNTLILFIAAGSVMALTIFRIIYVCKEGYLQKLFREAMQHESKGDEEGAMRLYMVLMEKSTKFGLRSSNVAEEARKRIKTLQIKIVEQNYYAHLKGKK